MYICEDCGHVFETPEKFAEAHGEHYEGCPECGSSFAVADECKDCGEYFSIHDLNGGICEDCLRGRVNEYKYNPKACYCVAKGETESVELNSFLTCMFTVEQIEEILMQTLLNDEKIRPVDCTAFVYADRTWIEDKIIEEMEV